jgi:hypothetical protein
MPPNRQQLLQDALAPGVQRQNLLQNGGFEQWHYGTSITLAQVFQTTADAWLVYLHGTGTANLAARDSANADTPSSSYALAYTVVTGGAGQGAGVVQRLDFVQLRGKTLSVSIRLKASVNSTMKFVWLDGITGAGQNQFSPTFAVTNAYQTFTFTFTPAATATSLLIGVMSETPGTFYADNAMLVLGGMYADFIPSIMYPDALPAERIASDLARPNLLTNGSFENWQRGTGPFTGNTAYGPDRWVLGVIGTDTMSISRGAAAAGMLGQFNVACNFTLGTGAGGSNLTQVIKKTEINLTGKTVTFSIWISTGVVGAVRPYIWFDGASSNTIYGLSNTGGAQVLYTTATIPNDATQVNMGIFFSATCSPAIDNASLVLGAVAPDFPGVHIADDLARCLRYYEILGGGGQDMILGGYQVGGSSAYTSLTFAAKKAVAPTCTRVGTWGLNNVSGQPVLSAATVNGMCEIVTITSTGYGDAYDTGATTYFSAEANP